MDCRIMICQKSHLKALIWVKKKLLLLLCIILDFMIIFFVFPDFYFIF